MKVAKRPDIERALDAAAPDIRLYLLHGPDESSSAMLAARLARAMGETAERVDLDGSGVAKDPARLADEAGAMSLFGEKRHIRLRLAGDEAAGAIAALLEAPVAGNPVVAIAGALRPTSATLKAALASPLAMAFASYPPDERDLVRLASSEGRAAGLEIDPSLGQRLADEAGGDRMRLVGEIEKLALYLDAAPDRPKRLDEAAIDALGAGSEGPAADRLVNLVFGGDAAGAANAIALLGTADRTALLRGAQRRTALLLELRAQVEGGLSPDAVMASAGRALFWKEKLGVETQLRMWRARDLAAACEALIDAERAMRGGNAAGSLVLDRLLDRFARAAARRR